MFHFIVTHQGDGSSNRDNGVRADIAFKAIIPLSDSDKLEFFNKFPPRPAPLPSTIVTEEINLAERCTVQLQSRGKSSFVRWGYGGVPSLADQLYLPAARFRFSALPDYEVGEELKAEGK